MRSPGSLGQGTARLMRVSAQIITYPFVVPARRTAPWSGGAGRGPAAGMVGGQRAPINLEELLEQLRVLETVRDA